MLRSPRRWLSGSSAVVTSEFVAWLRAGGASFDKLAIKHTALGRGVVATAAYEPGETLLSVPEALLLTVDKASRRADVAASLGAARAKGVDANGGNLALALFLAGDRSEAWRPYRNVISRSVSHLPCFWPTADEALLAGSPLGEDVVRRRDEIRRDCRSLGLTAVEDRQAFAFAEAQVLSRAFAFNGTRAMVPFADLMNTARHHERHVDFAFERGAFVMRAVRRGAAGEPVTDSYGPKSNARYLLNYGFAMADNRDEAGRLLDDAALDVALLVDAGAKSSAWMPPGDDGDAPKLRIRLNGDDDGDFSAALSAYRVSVATPSEFEMLETGHLRPKRAQAAFDGRPRPHLQARAVAAGLATAPFVSEGNERAALRALRSAALAAADALAPHDPKPDDPPNRAHARLYLRGQRAALEAAAATAAAREARIPAEAASG